VRTKRDYEVYAGIDLTNKKAHPDVFLGNNPDPVTIHTEADWKKCITIEEFNNTNVSFGASKKDPILKPLCIVSDKFRFICFCIAKNASSTLRAEFKKPQYQSYECLYHKIEQDKLDKYFTFALLRDPVTRLLSAYQELSFRKDKKLLLNEDRSFYFMDDNMERFHAFIAEVQYQKWDSHVAAQHDYICNKRIDFLGRVEDFNESMKFVFNTLNIPYSLPFPIIGSRAERIAVKNYRKYYIKEIDYSLKAIIREIYKNDVELLSLCHMPGRATKAR
jgi:hypothetical protein